MADSNSGRFVSRHRAWYVVTILTLLYVVSFVDRVIASLMMSPISKEFDISDTQLGLVVGSGFALVYSLCSLPLAQLIDSRERRRVVAGGAILWSAATIVSGFSRDLYEFAALRACVAIGEAVLMPAAISLMADLFPPDRRAGPIAVFGGIGAIMVGGSWILGASALDVASLFAQGGGMAPWRITLIVVGAPGLLLALLFLLTVSEPVRIQGGAGGVDPGDASIASLIVFLRRSWTMFLPLFIGVALFATYTFGIVTWLPTVIVRAHGLSYQAAGYGAGIACGLMMTIGAFGWPLLAAKLERRWPRRGSVVALLISGVLAFPAMALAATSSSLPILLIGSAWSMGCLISLSVLPAHIVQLFGPARMQARLMALLIFATSMIGYSSGAAIIPILGKIWAAKDVPIAYGLATLGAGAGFLGITCFALAARQSRRLLDAGVLQVGGGNPRSVSMVLPEEALPASR
jgi:MFS family permease